MLQTGASPDNIFRQVEQIHISDGHYQSHGWFGLLGIRSVANDVLPNHLELSYLQKLAGDTEQVHDFYYRVISYMIAKLIEVSITNTSFKKIRIHQKEYEWSEARSLISNYGPTMIYILFKSINPNTRIGISTLKYEIKKANLSKFVNNLKDLLDEISSNYTIIIYHRELHEDFV